MPEPHPSESANLTRRSFLLHTGTAAAALALGGYAATHARHELGVVDREVAIRNLPEPFHGFRVVQVSDMHFTEYTEAWFLKEVVRRVNGLKADLVVLTGDFVSRGPRSYAYARRVSDGAAEIFAALTCPERFSILGNHDAAVGPEYITHTLNDHRLPVLSDTYVPIERGGSRIWLCGARDPGVLGCDPALAIPARPDGPVIFLAHEPDYADVLARHPRFPLVDLMLSGHSHGGQLRLPFIGPLVLPPMGQKYVEGMFHIGHMQLYVNRGVGTVGLPLRLNCPPEITEFTLQPA